jgi:RNA polymerase sigma factor for flagellar operon FliA
MYRKVVRKMLTKTQEDIVIQYMPAAKRIAKSFWDKYQRKYEFEELLSEAYKILVEAIPKYDSSRNVKMLTYVYNSIKWGLLRFIRDDNWFQAESRKDRLKYAGNSDISLEDYIQFDNGERETEYSSRTLEDRNAKDPLDGLIYEEIFKILPSDLGDVLYLRYEKELTQRAIAKLFNTTQANISRKEKRVYKLIREMWQISV